VTVATLDRVLLVGFMGSGKSSVGRVVADRLGWRFVDFDVEIERDAGASIPEVFRTRGEPYFRRLESEVAERLLGEQRVVLGSGGGWGAVPDRLSALPGGTASFWLKVSPQTAVARISSEPGARPLLDGPDPLQEARLLLGRRDRSYRSARWAVDTERSSVEDVAARILEILVREYPETVIE
jgi:shikimate kinase